MTAEEFQRGIQLHMRSIMQGTNNYLRQSFAPLGLPPVQGWLFLHLCENGAKNISQLCEEMMFPVSHVSRMCRKLESVGLIKRERSSADARVVNITVTKKGRSLMDCHTRGRRSLGNPRLFDSLSDQDKISILEALSKLSIIFSKEVNE